MQMKQLSPQAIYQIQYPNARVELLASSVITVLRLLLEGAQEPTRSEAHAASIYLDTVMVPLAIWTAAAEQAIETHRPDPARWTVPDS